MESSAKYWEDAASEREAAVHREADEAVRQLLEIYESAYDDLQSEIKKIEYNYSVRFGVDTETASKYLSRELNKQGMNELAELLLKCNEEERAKILEYIQRDGLSTRAYGARASRYKELQDIIQTRAMKLAVSARAMGENIIKTAYKNNYYRIIDDTAFGLDCGVSFTLIDDNALEAVLKKRWSGKRFSERVWTNTQKLADETQEIIARYIVSGRSLDKAAGEIRERFDVAQTRATTLIRTEMAHARAEGDLKAYKELEVEEYKFMASLDERTCDECGPLDGQVMKLAEAVEGVNYPVIHPRCRCTTTVNMDYLKRRAYNPVTGKSELIDGSVTYEEWVNNMTAEEKAEFDAARKKIANKSADKLQHQRYREVLGKDVPKGFDKWQELKYNDSERYAELKELYKGVSWQLEALKNRSDSYEHKIPFISVPNSVIDNYSQGKLIQRRYYGRTGKPRLDIDLTNHNNPKIHTVVPHYHDWQELKNGDVKRDKAHTKPLEVWHIIANKDILKG